MQKLALVIVDLFMQILILVIDDFFTRNSER